MATLDQLGRRLVSYAVMLTFLAVMSMVVGLSSRSVINGVEDPDRNGQAMETTVES